MFQGKTIDISEHSQGKQTHLVKKSAACNTQITFYPQCYKNKPKTSQISEQSQGKQAHGGEKIQLPVLPKVFLSKMALSVCSCFVFVCSCITHRHEIVYQTTNVFVSSQTF
jgi:hypothetical protein